MRPRLLSIVLLCAGALPPFAGLGQVDQVATPPVNIVLVNHNGVPVGPFGGLEGPAVVARVVGDPVRTAVDISTIYSISYQF
jgi:hypothetical protein